MSHPIPAVGNLLNLTGKVAIITGASQGIGASIARRLAEAGAKTVVHYRNNKADAERVLEEIRSVDGQAITHGCDLSTEKGAEGLIGAATSEFGQLDIMVNNAGIFPVKPLLEMSHEEWSAMYSANVESAFLCTKLAAKSMREQKPTHVQGTVINITSITGTSPAAAHSHYNSSKAALLMFTRSAAQELGAFGIRVNAVSPGLTNRAGLEQAWPEGVKSWHDKAPLGRLGEPEDIADACLFLASPAARFITGNNLIVDGGMMSTTLY